MENWKTVVRLLSPGDFLATIDLEDTYFLLPVHQNDRKFLRFRFRGQLFEFRVLPFGLASAPFIFTKILKPVLYSLRGKGYFSVNYLDDFLLMAQSHDQCLDNIAVSVNLLSSLSFVINKQKSVLRPSRSCRFLGFIFDTNYFSVSLPANKRRKLLHKTLDMLSRKHCKIRVLASYVGSLTSVCSMVSFILSY